MSARLDSLPIGTVFGFVAATLPNFMKLHDGRVMNLASRVVFLPVASTKVVVVRPLLRDYQIE